MSDSLDDLLTVPGLSEFKGTEVAPCVYFLVQDGVVIYVGQTQRLIARLKNHRSCHWKKNFDRVFYLQTPKETLLKVECDFIHRINPTMNSRYEFRLWCRWNPSKPLPTFRNGEHMEQYIRRKNLESFRMSPAAVEANMKRIYGSKLIGDELW